MNRRAQKSVFGFTLLILLFVFIIGAVTTIEPLKETLNATRSSSSLNCPGTDSFNQSDYDDDTDSQKLVRRPVCFVTGFTMVYFVGSFIIAAFVWLVINWRKVAK